MKLQNLLNLEPRKCVCVCVCVCVCAYVCVCSREDWFFHFLLIHHHHLHHHHHLLLRRRLLFVRPPPQASRRHLQNARRLRSHHRAQLPKLRKVRTEKISENSRRSRGNSNSSEPTFAFKAKAMRILWRNKHASVCGVRWSLQRLPALLWTDGTIRHHNVQQARNVMSKTLTRR